jgi:hypothetical protein
MKKAKSKSPAAAKLPAVDQAVRPNGDKRWVAVYPPPLAWHVIWAATEAAAAGVATAQWGKPLEIRAAGKAPQAGERGRSKTTGFAVKTTPEELAELRARYGAPQPPAGNFSGNILAKLLEGE